MGSARPRALHLAAVVALCFACAHRPAQKQAARPLKPDEQRGVMHHVQPGETLWRIAQAYQVPLESILQENALEDPSRLQESSLLFIPGAARELKLPPAGEIVTARAEQRPARRLGPSAIPRAGQRPLDPAAHGEPLAWPAPGVLISGFGARERDRHEGIDLACPEGTRVLAAEDGLVLFAGEQRGYGNLVLLAHEGDLVTVYAHNSENLVSKGDRVSRGDAIALVGHTGNATGPHLHFEVRVAARPRDPLGFLR